MSDPEVTDDESEAEKTLEERPAQDSDLINFEQDPGGAEMANGNEVQMSRIAKLPPFWKEDPVIWFCQVEASFAITRVTVDETKFQYLLANLDPSVLPFVSDIIQNPPVADKYNAIKTRILESFSESKESKLRRMLKGQLLGDRKPSHFLQHLRNLSSNQCEDVVLKSLFLEQLPQQINAILAASAEADLNRLAAMADQIMDLQRPTQVYAVSNANSGKSPQDHAAPANFTQTEMLRQINALAARLDKALNEGNFSRSRSRNRPKSSGSGTCGCNRGRSQTPSCGGCRSKSPCLGNRDCRGQNDEKKQVCFYHRRFGEKARNCNKPCPWAASGNTSEN